MLDLNVVLKRKVVLVLSKRNNGLYMIEPLPKFWDTSETVVALFNRNEASAIILHPVQLLNSNIKKYPPIPAQPSNYDRRYISMTIGDVLKFHNILKDFENYYVKLDQHDEGYFQLDWKQTSHFKFKMHWNQDVGDFIQVNSDVINRIFNALLLQSSDRKLIALFDDHWDELQGNIGLYSTLTFSFEKLDEWQRDHEPAWAALQDEIDARSQEADQSHHDDQPKKLPWPVDDNVDHTPDVNAITKYYPKKEQTSSKKIDKSDE